MHTVAPLWRVAALILPLASMAGCDWLPVRRRIDPSLYPVPTRPDPSLIRAHHRPGAPPDAAGPGPAAVAGVATDDRRLPPLPDLVPVSPDELLGPPAPTPLIDAAVVRAEAVREAAFASSEESEADPDAPPVPVAEEPEADGPPAEVPVDRVGAEGGPGEPPPAPPASGIELPPVPEDIPPDLGPPASPDGIPGDPSPAPPAAPSPTIPADSAGPPLDDAAHRTPAPRSDDASDAGPSGSLELPEQVPDDAADGDGPSDPQRPAAPLAGSGGDAGGASLWHTVMTAFAEANPGPAGSQTGAGPESEGGEALRVARLALCREVLGFDRIDPIDAGACRAGQDVLVYCELEGVRYVPEGDGHVSRLTTTLEILGRPDAPALWTNVLPVEDRCSRPRHDYFVGYRVPLPGSLAPGRYRLRVSQRDLLSGSEDVGESPFEIVSGTR